MPNLKTLKVMVSNSDLLFQENEGLHFENSNLHAECSALRTKNSALQSKVNNQNTYAVCGKDSASSTVSDQVHVIVLVKGAFLCSVVTEDVFF